RTEIRITRKEELEYRPSGGPGAGVGDINDAGKPEIRPVAGAADALVGNPNPGAAKAGTGQCRTGHECCSKVVGVLGRNANGVEALSPKLFDRRACEGIGAAE